MIVLHTQLTFAKTAQAASPQFADIQPILVKYCVGCHNADDREGGLSLENYADLQAGLEDAPVLLAGQAKSSRLFRVVAGLAEPKMPPDDEVALTADEIETLQVWIDAGASGPSGQDAIHPKLRVPAIASQINSESQPVTAIASSPVDNITAIARFGSVALREESESPAKMQWNDFPGKVNSLSFSSNGDRLVVASGIAGLYGQADVFDVRTGDNLTSVVGHRDTLYDAELSPDGETLATASYYGQIILWNAATGESLRTIKGHNGAVFDIEFDPSGAVIASASADETVKLWKVSSGERLDTLSQPEGAQYAVAFSPDGEQIVAGGADNRLRVWNFVSRERPQINPLQFVRFAHDVALSRLAFARDGRTLVTTGEDRLVRAWETRRYAESQILDRQPAAIHDLSVSDSGEQVNLALANGSVIRKTVPLIEIAQSEHLTAAEFPGESTKETIVDHPQNAEEIEPNDKLSQAQFIQLPTVVTGVVQPIRDSQVEDVDLYRFEAAAGEQWIIEINASREKSSLDSKIAVLTADGERIERVILQATRDSYFTFRGKNSTQSDDYRLHNWEELQLNEFLYAGGEVTKLWAYPRGPDSGFNVYPGNGKRFTYFGTSGVAHALNEPAYIVEPHQPGEPLVPTGLPVFPVYFENDDDPRRQLGADSRLTFIAPEDGEYLIQVCDVRGFGGESFKYKLAVRKPQPSFTAKLSVDDGPLSRGGAKEFRIEVQRADGFEGPVRVDIEGFPTDFQATSPVIIEAGQNRAFGIVSASTAASDPPAGHTEQIRVSASAEVAGHSVEQSLPWKTELKLGEVPEVFVRVLPAEGANNNASKIDLDRHIEQPLELVIAPGETISAWVRVQRKPGFNDRVSFGQLGSGRNLPHGVYVDNIGLNGLMIVKDSSQREFFITADTWVPETTRMFHLRTEQNGNQSSLPVILHVRQANR